MLGVVKNCLGLLKNVWVSWNMFVSDRPVKNCFPPNTIFDWWSWLIYTSSDWLTQSLTTQHTSAHTAHFLTSRCICYAEFVQLAETSIIWSRQVSIDSKQSLTSQTNMRNWVETCFHQPKQAPSPHRLYSSRRPHRPHRPHKPHDPHKTQAPQTPQALYL